MKLSLVRMVAAALLAGGMLWPATPASAAVTCQLSAGTLTLMITGTSNGATIFESGSFTIFGPEGQVTCSGGNPTTTNTNQINITNASSSGSPYVNLSNIPYRDPGGDEVDVSVTMGPGTADGLTTNLDPSGDMRIGSAGINTNARENANDVDITFTGAEQFQFNGTVGNEVIGGHGGEGTGGPFSSPFTSFAMEGNDQLTGGSGDDHLIGGTHFTTDSGIDTVSYPSASDAVTVDLVAGSGGSPSTGNDQLYGIKHAIGGPRGDTLLGSAVTNRLIGGAGNDTLEGAAGNDRAIGGDGRDRAEGAGGNDRLTGSRGNDTLLGQGDDDNLNGGPQVDHCVGGPGADTLQACET
jgi:Ca2+-binding RTX toxin-like protein